MWTASVPCEPGKYWRSCPGIRPKAKWRPWWEFLVILSNLNIYKFALGWHRGFGGVNLVCEEGEVFYGAGLKPNAELKW